MPGVIAREPVDTSAWQSLTWCGGIVLVSVALSGMLFRRRTA
jgi:ABC-2 type transport system permease protein